MDPACKSELEDMDLNSILYKPSVMIQKYQRLIHVQGSVYIACCFFVTLWLVNGVLTRSGPYTYVCPAEKICDGVVSLHLQRAAFETYSETWHFDDPDCPSIFNWPISNVCLLNQLFTSPPPTNKKTIFSVWNRIKRLSCILTVKCFLSNTIFLSICTIVWYKYYSLDNMVTLCHNSRSWCQNSSTMATINRK